MTTVDTIDITRENENEERDLEEQNQNIQQTRNEQESDRNDVNEEDNTKQKQNNQIQNNLKGNTEENNHNEDNQQTEKVEQTKEENVVENENNQNKDENVNENQADRNQPTNTHQEEQNKVESDFRKHWDDNEAKTEEQVKQEEQAHHWQNVPVEEVEKPQEQVINLRESDSNVEKVSLPLDMSVDVSAAPIQTQPVSVSQDRQEPSQKIQDSSKPSVQQVPTQPIIEQVPKVEPVYTARDRINDSNTLKAKGNAEFKEKEYKTAMHNYFSGLQILDPQVFSRATVQQIEEAKNITFALMLNIAQCHSNLKNFNQAVLCISEVLKSDPYHFKALYRRANGYFHLQKYEQALADIKLAYQIDQTNGQANQIYNKVVIAYNQQLQERKKQQKQIYKNMFSAEKSEANTSVINKIQTAQVSKIQYLKYLLFGGLGAGTTYLLTKHLNITNETEQIVEVAASGISASLFASKNQLVKISGFIGLAGILGYMFSKK